MTSSNEKDILDRISQIKFWQRNGKRAPHKPLLLLLTLGRIHQGKDRLQSWTEIRAELTTLLNSYGRVQSKQVPQEPYKRLPNGALWEIVDSDGFILGYKPNAGLNQLADTKGGLPVTDYQMLRENPGIIFDCAQLILKAHFPDSWHAEILERVHLPNQTQTIDIEHERVQKHVKKRDPQFRERILRAYARTCAICGSGLRIQDSLIDLEAAHIMWHQAGGPDIENNGLALCTFHHKAFDRGAIGLRASRDEFFVRLSPDINGQGPSQKWLNDYADEPIRKPNDNRHKPNTEFVEWHYEQVFRSYDQTHR